MELAFDLGYGEKGNWHLSFKSSFKSSFIVI